MRISSIVLAGALSLSLLGGCYDQGNIDECIGLSCANGFQWPYGGEIRVWYIALPDGSELRRLSAYFMDAQTPEILPDLPIGYCAPDHSSDLGTNRHYFDVGDSVTMHLGDHDYVLPKFTKEDNGGMPVPDYADREHDIAYLLETSDPTGDGFFDATHKIDTAKHMDFSDMLDTLYMPSPTEIISPVGNPVIVMHRHQPVDVQWRELAPSDPGVVVGGAIVLGPDQGQEYSCVVANTGQFTVPAETVDALEFDTGIFVIGTATDQSILRPDGQIVHQFAMNCHLYPYQIVD
jgi:hypothetical protein